MGNDQLIARRLLGIHSEVSEGTRDPPELPWQAGGGDPPPEEAGAPMEAAKEAAALVRELDRLLTRSGWRPEAEMPGMPVEGEWVLGEWTQHASPREILRGFLRPLRRRPLLRRVPEQVVLYLVRELSDGRDGLKREQHSAAGVGWHYYYLDRRRRRSNAILCWDTRWVAPTTVAGRPASLRPLFWEFHGEGRAEFPAKPDLWGDFKRISMHESCRVDLTRPIAEFRPASVDANPTWPLRTAVTPAPALLQPSFTKAKQGRSKRR
jgi:hypothetical protein